MSIERSALTLLRAIPLVALSLFAVPGYGSLVLSQPNETSGTGLGTVNTVLTIQNQAGSTTESGCVAFNGTMDVVGPAACPAGVSGGDEVGVNQTRTVAELGLSSAFNLRLVFNASEDGDRAITLENLVLRIFSPDGTVLFSSEPFDPVLFEQAFRGTGTSGFVFRLDTQQAAQANQFFANGQNRIGLAASASGVGGGSETFYVADAGALTDAEADLSIAKGDSPDPVVVGETLTYQLTINNAGPNMATNVEVTDTLPASVTLNSISGTTGSCTSSGRNISCELGDMAAGTSETITIRVTPNTAGVTITNNATVSGDQPDPDPADNFASEETSVVGVAPLRADLSVNKVDSPDPVLVGSPLTYTITVANAGPDPASNVTLTDTLPQSVTFGTVNTTRGSCTRNGRTISCDLGTINSGANATVTITVTPTADATITNTVTVSADESDPNPANNSDTESTEVGAGAPERADLTLVKNDSPDPVAVGENIVYTLTVGNNGPDAATGVTITDTLPASLTFVSASAGCTQAGRVITCDVGGLAVGASAQVQITATATAAGTVTNSASVSGNEGDSNPANNNATEETQVLAAAPPRANLGVVKTDSVDPVNVGSPLTYMITVSNAGPDAATGVVLTDTLPASVTFNSMTTSQGLCTENAGRTITCELGGIAAGGNATLSINVTPTVAQLINNVVNVSGNENDGDTSNNADNETTQVGPAPAAGADLMVAKTDSPDPVTAGSSVTYSIIITNNGPNPATGVQLIDTLPTASAFVSATASQGAGCTRVGQTLTCNVGTIAAGATATATIQVVATTPGTIVNTVTVSGNETDPNAANNQAQATTTVGAAPDVAAIPTLNEWGLILLGLALAGFAVFRIRF